MKSVRFFGACALLLALASCGGGNEPSFAQLGQTRQSAALVQGAVPPFATFSGNLTQYTVFDNGAGSFTVIDNLNQTAQVVAPGARLRFADTAIALDLDGVAGQAYRLYQAAFNRAPDLPGLGFQINALEGLGRTLPQVSQNFIDSPEFQATYGNVTNVQFVTLLYNNVLHRAPEPDGLAFHLSYLEGTNPEGRIISRAEVLVGFSESPENKANVLGNIRNGIEYIPFGSAAPSNPAAEFAASYSGTIRGVTESGTLQLTVAADGTITAVVHSNELNVDLGGSAALQNGGKFPRIDMAGGGRTMAIGGSIQLSSGLATGTWIYPGTTTSGVFNATRVAAGPKFSQVQAIIQQRCVPCHSANPKQPGFPSAPAGIRFDTEAQIRQLAEQIRFQAVITKNMPFGNQTGMTQAERDVLEAWFVAGTP